MSKIVEENTKSLMDTSNETSLCIQQQTAMVEWPLPLNRTMSKQISTAATGLSAEQSEEVVDTERNDDFVGSASALKALFTLPSDLGTSNSECLAVHRVGYVLNKFNYIQHLFTISNISVNIFLIPYSSFLFLSLFFSSSFYTH